jgi:hypothetical protein
MPDQPRISFSDIPAAMPAFQTPSLSDRVTAFRVNELPSWADMGERPVVTLTFAEKIQYVLELTRVSWIILQIALFIANEYTKLERTMFRDLKTTVTTVVGVVVYIVAKFGFEVPPEVTEAVIVLTLAVVGLLAGDSKKTEPKP